MSNKDTQASETLERFAPQLRWVVDSVMRSFQLPYSNKDEVEQEAQVLLISYADLFDTPIDGHGKLAAIETLVEGDEGRVKALIGRQLRIDLSKKVARQSEREGVFHTDSLDELVDDGFEPTDDGIGERGIIETIDNDRSENRLHKHYPELAMQTLDGKSIAEIMEATGKSRATVFRHIDIQKAQFVEDQERYKLTGQVQARGLMVEGNETLDELREAVKWLVS